MKVLRLGGGEEEGHSLECVNIQKFKFLKAKHKTWRGGESGFNVGTSFVTAQTAHIPRDNRELFKHWKLEVRRRRTQDSQTQ